MLLLVVLVAATLPLEKPLKCIDHTPSTVGQLKPLFLTLFFCVNDLSVCHDNQNCVVQYCGKLTSVLVECLGV